MIELKKTGDVHKIDLTKTNYSVIDKKALVKLNWKTAVDLDLHAFAINLKGELIHVYFGKKSSDCKNIILDHDAGVGNTSGNNVENMLLKDITQMRRVIFVANIFRFFGNLFSSGDCFSKYDGRITLNTLGEEITIFLNSKEIGRWAVIGMIDNQNGVSEFRNLNTILKNEPTLEYVKNLS